MSSGTRKGERRLAVPRQERPLVTRDKAQRDEDALEQALARLEYARFALAALEMEVHHAAVDARIAGATWQTLGDALGMTAKSAWKRYVWSEGG